MEHISSPNEGLLNDCPESSLISPCRCKLEQYLDDKFMELDCSFRDLNNSMISDVLDAFNSTMKRPLSRFNLSNNRLTQLPEQLRILDRLRFVNLGHNQIKVVRTGTFKSKSSKRHTEVFLNDNKIIKIEPNSFQGSTYFVRFNTRLIYKPD